MAYPFKYYYLLAVQILRKANSRGFLSLNENECLPLVVFKFLKTLNGLVISFPLKQLNEDSSVNIGS